ncbi:MAG: ribosome biogenesis GTPase YlqF [Petrotogaceae bacterium]|jgi:ribosome biogenesis GTPase A|nr:ribosome biogenesis GTPase YlqF [Petrotogaceae bacterium]
MWYPGHIAKAKKSIKENLRAVNAVIELVDSRAPYSSRAYEYQELFRNKKRIIVFNKYDICDIKKTDLWIQKFREKGYCVLATNLKSINIKNFLMKNVFTVIPETYGEKSAMVVGVPNVGKSTLINSLKGSRSAAVGNMPGITRGVQWVSVNEKFRLLDTPGILFPEIYKKELSYKLALLGSLKVEETDAEEILEYFFEFLIKEYPHIISQEYMKEEYPFGFFLSEYAKKRNFVKKGGEADIQRVCKSWLKEINDGKFIKATYESVDEYDDLMI